MFINRYLIVDIYVIYFITDNIDRLKYVRFVILNISSFEHSLKAYSVVPTPNNLIFVTITSYGPSDGGPAERYPGYVTARYRYYKRWTLNDQPNCNQNIFIPLTAQTRKSNGRLGFGRFFTFHRSVNVITLIIILVFSSFFFFFLNTTRLATMYGPDCE